MSQYIYQLAVLIPVDEDERVNGWMERQGYGPNNISRECIGIEDSDDADATHLCNSAPADAAMLNSIGAGLAINPLVKYAVGSAGDEVLSPMLSGYGLRLKPVVEDTV
jgi:hypothetical protein